MSMKPGAYSVTLLAIATIVACAGIEASRIPLALEQETEQLEGWFSAKGEWTLFPLRDFAKYTPPFGDGSVEDHDQCVSLINATGAGREDFRMFHGKKVVVDGYAVKYDELASGSSVTDRLLSKRYFKGEIVENYCLRELVFAVTAINMN